MRFKKIIKLFQDNNVMVYGLKGRGKDLLTSNVIVRRNLPYISNVDYGGQWYPFEYQKLACGNNKYSDFLSGDLHPYVFPYPDGTDVYLSDCGIYFPAQYCNELNKAYPYLSVFAALGRHVGLSNFHCNAQSLNRVYDKLREQSEFYLCCNRCFYLKGLVLQKVTIYDKYDSAVAKVKPFKAPLPLFANKEMKLNRELMKNQFQAAHGEIRSGWLLYFNKSKYDTRLFKKMLEEGSTIVSQEV